MARLTSIRVYREIERNGLLSRRRWEVYKILFEHGPLTAIEVISRSGSLGGIRNGMGSRLSELRSVGAVYEVGTRRCSVTGHNVILWDVTDRLPLKAKPVALRKSRKKLEEENFKLRSLCRKLLDEVRSAK